MYDLGKGIKRSPREAQVYYQKAAKQGHTDACVRLGKRLLKQPGQGKQGENDRRAAEYFIRAATSGSVEAKECIEMMRKEGRGMKYLPAAKREIMWKCAICSKPNPQLEKHCLSCGAKRGRTSKIGVESPKQLQAQAENGTHELIVDIEVGQPNLQLLREEEKAHLEPNMDTDDIQALRDQAKKYRELQSLRSAHRSTKEGISKLKIPSPDIKEAAHLPPDNSQSEAIAADLLLRQQVKAHRESLALRAAARQDKNTLLKERLEAQKFRESAEPIPPTSQLKSTPLKANETAEVQQELTPALQNNAVSLEEETSRDTGNSRLLKSHDGAEVQQDSASKLQNETTSHKEEKTGPESKSSKTEDTNISEADSEIGNFTLPSLSFDFSSSSSFGITGWGSQL